MMLERCSNDAASSERIINKVRELYSVGAEGGLGPFSLTICLQYNVNDRI